MMFSFGRNWINYSRTINDQKLRSAEEDIRKWLENGIAGKTVLDIGCGAGIHSHAFWKLGARSVVSFDNDKYSVIATTSLWKKSGQPENWNVILGSVLDIDFLSSLGEFDIIYSWGVLHHTGKMFEAIANVIELSAKNESKILIALYQGVETYERDLRIKTEYNRASWLGKRYKILSEIIKMMKRRRKKGQNPLTWNENLGRGMNTYYDLVDWLGGLPYEVASPEVVEEFMLRRGNWQLQKYNDKQACFVYLFGREPISKPAFVDYLY